MELYQLKTFLVIARTGNLTRAATELHVSQPTLSGQLKALEDELDVSLFVRTPRGMKLSDAGARLCDKAQEVIDRATELTVLAASLAHNSPARCRVGLNTTATALRIPELVCALATTAPQLRLEFYQGQTHSIIEDIARGKLDCGFLFGRCEQAGLASIKLVEVALAVVGPTTSKQELIRVSWESLLAETWVMPPELCPFYDKTRELLLPLGKWPNDSITADDEATMLDLVRAKAGIALLPASMVEGQKGVCIVRRTQLHLELDFAWQSAKSEATEVRPVLQALENIWQ